VDEDPFRTISAGFKDKQFSALTSIHPTDRLLWGRFLVALSPSKDLFFGAKHWLGWSSLPAGWREASMN
jgi:hypothetical protein